MKKMIILPIMLIAVIVNGQLQPGIKAGVNVSNFTGGDFSDIETNSLTSYHAGLYLRVLFGKLAIQPELLFSEQGAKLQKPGEEEIHLPAFIDGRLPFCAKELIGGRIQQPNHIPPCARPARIDQRRQQGSADPQRQGFAIASPEHQRHARQGKEQDERTV